MDIVKPHTAILWKQGALNQNADPTFSSPVEFVCRWQDRNQKYQSLSGDERISNSQIYYQETDLITPGDRVARGSMNSIILKTMSVEDLVAMAMDLDLVWIDQDQNAFSQEFYEGMLLGSLVVASIEGSLQTGQFNGSLIQLLYSGGVIEGIDYSALIQPWQSPYVRMVGAVESTSSLGGEINLYKAMTEVYAKGY